MDAEKQAKLMVEEFKPYVYCYAGSGYLTGDESKSSDFYKAVKEEIKLISTTN